MGTNLVAPTMGERVLACGAPPPPQAAPGSSLCSHYCGGGGLNSPPDSGLSFLTNKGVRGLQAGVPSGPILFPTRPCFLVPEHGRGTLVPAGTGAPNLGRPAMQNSLPPTQSARASRSDDTRVQPSPAAGTHSAWTRTVLICFYTERPDRTGR